MHGLRRRLPALAGICLTSGMLDAAIAAEVEVSLGEHRIRFEIPDNWDLIERENEYIIRNDVEQVHLFDSGPVTPAGFEREIRKARLLFRSQRYDESLETLDRIRLRAAFPTTAQWQTVSRPWSRVRRARAGLDAHAIAEVEGAFDEIITAIAALPPPSFESLASGMLALLEPLDRREVSRARHVVIDGRTGLRIETWDALTHAHPAELLFVSIGDSLLVARTRFGEFARVAPAFETLVASIEL